MDAISSVLLDQTVASDNQAVSILGVTISKEDAAKINIADINTLLLDMQPSGTNRCMFL